MDAVVAHAGAKPTFVFPRAEDVFQRASDITWHQDEPFGSTSIFAQWCVFEEARRAGSKLYVSTGKALTSNLLATMGALAPHLGKLAQERRIGSLLRSIVERRHYHGTSMPGAVADVFKTFAPSRPGETKLFTTSIPKRIRTATGWERISSGRKATRKARSRCRPTSRSSTRHRIRTLCMTLTFASNLQMLLHWEDRNSMAHSIEARVPFLDHPLVEFTLALGNDRRGSSRR